ncbi:hypothetical protein GCM10022243_30480 [Saccharothrix violaceirubra]|uniref:HicB-like protein involved in pilus formation n=1 Tax=Saccharothrix violaceirubra TaxID=413306 RepID=A0A7W7T4Y5_9PSEU|nr:toxin-antitoxin system HicB family antitoxin [Saccharothrix violaceirubra]MBB4966674.1 hypothetical protein [Saccharothrix violaceirubra]
MDLTPFVDNLRNHLAATADAAGEESRAVTERITSTLESALRLMLLDALSAAAEEITRDLAPGSVDVRLRGRELGFHVDLPPRPEAEPVPAAPEPVDDDGTTTTRINLRLSEQLKARIEEAASRERMSVNAWIVRAAATTLAAGERARVDQRSGDRGRFTGWVR